MGKEEHLLIEGLDDQLRQGGEKAIGHRVAGRAPDRPAPGMEDHLPDYWRGSKNAHPIPGLDAEHRIEEHRDGPYPRQRCAVVDPRGDPNRLLRRQQVAGRGCLDLGHAFEGVFELVKVMGVPTGYDLVADLKGVRTSQRR